jgi:hypothetical protein
MVNAGGAVVRPIVATSGGDQLAVAFHATDAGADVGPMGATGGVVEGA